MISSNLYGRIRGIFPFPLLPLFLLVGIFYVTFICRVAIAPLLPVMKVDLGLGLAGAGSLFFWMASGYCTRALHLGIRHGPVMLSRKRSFVGRCDGSRDACPLASYLDNCFVCVAGLFRSLGGPLPSFRNCPVDQAWYLLNILEKRCLSMNWPPIWVL